ncbi:MAG: PTS sugar transporter subunit IIB [Firmicutes bacterium]|nr:PTS sugar transporter subunit IIB [Bacillota bacterium]
MKVITVCVNGMGSSLILKMTTEVVLKEMGIPATVEAADTGTFGTVKADLILASPTIAKQLADREAVIPVVNFVDKTEIRSKIEAFFRSKGKGGTP